MKTHKKEYKNTNPLNSELPFNLVVIGLCAIALLILFGVILNV